jgi:prepilin-type N-terminal cleavage/methylation domain-containing protein
MVALRKNQAGFTLTEVMVVVVILSLLAALSTPLFRRDNTARKGRGWAYVVAQALQRARFQAMGDRANIHVELYRDHFKTYRQAPSTVTTTGTGTDTSTQTSTESLTTLSTTFGPEPDNDQKTIAIWDARTNGTAPGSQNTAVPIGRIVFVPLGGTAGNATWRIYIRNEFLSSTNPDGFFVIKVHGLTGLVSMRQLP